MKIALFGCGQITGRIASVIEDTGHQVAGIITLSELPTGAVPVSCGVLPMVCLEPTPSAEQLWLLHSLGADLALVAGFPRLIPRDVLCLFRLGVIGSHPTPLPLGRGRHPVQWMLNMGIRKSVVTFFKCVVQADAGPVVLRIKYKLRSDDTVGTVNARLDGIVERGFRQILAEQLWRLAELQTGLATGFQARTRFDCMIDPRMSVEAIMNLVRSFSEPFPGCTLLYESSEFHVLRADIADGNPWQSLGKIVEVDDESVVMRVADGYVRLVLREDCQVLNALPVIKTPMEYFSSEQSSKTDANGTGSDPTKT